jgi:hypothetical protein
MWKSGIDINSAERAFSQRFAKAAFLERNRTGSHRCDFELRYSLCALKAKTEDFMEAQFAMECRVSAAAHRFFLHIQAPAHVGKFVVPMWTGTSNHLLTEYTHGEVGEGWLKASNAPGTIQPFCTVELCEDEIPYLQQHRVG